MAGGLFGGGTGSAIDPYIVEDALDLDAVRNDLTAFYKQNQNIDLNVAPYNTGLGWEPIGTTANRFRGGYNGDGYTITNLFINRDVGGIGLFGYANSPIFQNISLTNVSIEITRSYCGALCGLAEGRSILGTGQFIIDNCTAQGNINSGNSQFDFVGGLVGACDSLGGNADITYEITDCWFKGSVKGRDYVGGLIGRGQYKTEPTNCYTEATVSGRRWVGGLIGHCFSNNASYLPTVTTCHSIGTVTGEYDCGGLIGFIGGHSTATRATVTGCNSGSNVTTTYNGTVAPGDGGLIGQCTHSLVYNSYSYGNVFGVRGNKGGLIGRSNNSSISKCYANGSVTGTSSAVDANTRHGGLIGYITSSIVNKCYARGNVTSGNVASGLVGIGFSADSIAECYATGLLTAPTKRGLASGNVVVTNSVWDTQTTTAPTSDGGSGKTTAQMKTKQTFIDLGWSIDDE